jgi:3-methyladenine DNA glycosylase AlkD
MALKAVGKRNPELRAAATASAARLAALESRAARSIGRGALPELGD